MYSATDIGPCSRMRFAMCLRSLFVVSGINNQYNSRKDHRHRQQLAHREILPDETDLLVGFAEEFDDKTAQAVPGHEDTEQHPRAAADVRVARAEEQHREQDQTFEQS